MKYTSLIALVGFSQAINMSGAGECTKYSDKHTCGENAECSWHPGFDEGKGSCMTQAAAVAQKIAFDCKSADNNQDQCSSKGKECVWTQGNGDNGSCTAAPKKHVVFGMVSGCNYTPEGKCLGQNHKGDTCAFDEEGICQ